MKQTGATLNLMMTHSSNYNSNQSHSLKSLRSHGSNGKQSDAGAKERKLLIEEVSVMRMVIEGVLQQYKAVTEAHNKEIDLIQGERDRL